MKKLSSINIADTYLSLFILICPILPAVLWRGAALYILCAITAAVFLWRILNKREIVLSFVSAVIAASFALSLMLLFFAYDRYEHLQLSAVLLLCFFISVFVRDAVAAGGAKRLRDLVYTSALFSALMNILHAIIFGDVLGGGYRFDYGFANNHLLAIFMFTAILCSKEILREKRNRTGVIAGDILLAVVFCAARSEIAVIAVSVFAIYTALRYAKKLSFFLPVIVIAVLGIDGGIIFATIRSGALSSAAGNFMEAIYLGLSRIIGVGGGGFESYKAVFETPKFDLPSLAGAVSAFGIFGLLIVAAAIVAALSAMRKATKFTSSAILLTLWCVFIPLLISPFLAALFLAALGVCSKKIVAVSLSKAAATAAVIVVCVALIVTAAVNPFDTSYLMRQIREELSTFDATSDMNAYSRARGLISEVMEINPHNYLPIRLRARAQSNFGAADNAYISWCEIMERYGDDVRLYPNMAEAIVDYMSRLPRGDGNLLTLNNVLQEYISRASEKNASREIMRALNDASDRAQQYMRSEWEFGVGNTIGGAEGE
ncbi:MAG: hypothetical protein Q4C12_03445 [Clostridia bacterium]|nr:hypothetical protein [Clostridia bacterium]